MSTWNISLFHSFFPPIMEISGSASADLKGLLCRAIQRLETIAIRNG
jgi:hypothetical protein